MSKKEAPKKEVPGSVISNFSEVGLQVFVWGLGGCHMQRAPCANIVFLKNYVPVALLKDNLHRQVSRLLEKGTR